MNNTGAAGAQAKKILIVEDEGVTAMDLKANLIKFGYDVPEIVTSGEDAVRTASVIQPDLILMDIKLDGHMSGIEAAEEIRKTDAIPIVYMTALTDTKTVGKARITEPFGYLSKPYSIDTLMSTIEVALYKGGVDAQRRKAEEALKASEKRLFEFINSATDAFTIWDSELNLVELNHTALRYLPPGVGKKDVIGKNLRDLEPNVKDSGRLEQFLNVIRTGKPFSTDELVLNLWSGEKVSEAYLNVKAFKVDEGLGIMTIDITERKRMEDERRRLEDRLRQAQKIESIGMLAGGVAHDFNNMLNIIIGYAELVLGKLHHADPLREEVREIIKAGQRSAALTRQLLAFSRKQVLQPEVLDVNALLKNLKNMLQRLIGEDIDLKLVAAKNLDCVRADPVQIEQVIMNLSVNARDAMPLGGKLVIETANVELDGQYARVHPEVMPGRHVMISLTDTGRGMDNDVLPRIFEPFFTTKEKGKGTGLGLSMVYGIVQQSGGSISVSSEQDKGTVFRIYLPSTDEKPGVKKSAPVEEKRRCGDNRNLLVVEDEDALRILFEKTLKRMGYHVAIAADGSETLLLIEEKALKPDLVITDVVMPNMGGVELVERLRKKQPGLKALYMSGYADTAIEFSGKLNPDTFFIQKPFQIKDLIAKIEKILKTQEGK